VRAIKSITFIRRGVCQWGFEAIHIANAIVDTEFLTPQKSNAKANSHMLYGFINQTTASGREG